jgi:hypothetical protein
MRRWVKIILVAIAVLVLGGAYDFWRGYHEQHSISAAFVYAIFGWIVFGPIIFIYWFFRRRKKGPPEF